jgi:putative membrane protein
MDSAGMGAGGGVSGWLVVVLLVFLLTVLVVALAYASVRIGDPDDGATRTLCERYAAGALDDDEFDSRLDRLREGD